MEGNFAVSPRNLYLYRLALEHSSTGVKDSHGCKFSNERLEFLGDAILDSIVAEYLYHSYPGTQEGELTKLKSKVVSRRFLNYIGKELGIADVLQVNISGKAFHPSLIGNAFEAIIGAIYLDQGYRKTRKSLLDILTARGMLENLAADVDFKSKLHEWCQKNRKTLFFHVLDEKQQAGITSYLVEVKVDQRAMGLGRGESKKAAEQKAAEEACALIFGR